MSKLTEKDDAERYIGGHGTPYDHGWPVGHTTINVLQFLYGLPFDNLVMAYVHALRPSMIRASRGEVTTDSFPWRVTILLTQDDKVWSISQEVEVAYASGFDVSEALKAAKKKANP